MSLRMGACFCVAAMIFAATGCNSARPQEIIGLDRTVAVLDVYEAVLRYQFGHNASGAQQSGAAYFVAVDDKDPTQKFLERFKDVAKKVFPKSRFAMGNGNLLFTVTGAKWIDDDTVEVDGGYYEGNLSSSGNTYRIQRKNGQWVVTEDKLHWIS